MTMTSEMGAGTEAHDWDLGRLERAALKGDLETVKSLTKAKPSHFTDADRSLFRSLAQTVCRAGHLTILQHLVEHLNVDINSATSTTVEGKGDTKVTSGSSLLQICIACDESHQSNGVHAGCTINTFSCIEWLINKDANLNQKNDNGEDAFATARKLKHLQALSCMSWSLLEECPREHPRHSRLRWQGPCFDVFGVIDSSRDLLEILGLIWHRLVPNYPMKDEECSQLFEICNILRPYITQSVCEETSASDYRRIGEPVCVFPRNGTISSCIIKIPLFAYIPQAKYNSRWTDAYDARTRLGIQGTTTNAGLEVFYTFDEYCYPDLSENVLKDRNGDQVVGKHIQNLAERFSEYSPMLAISQACLWRFQTENKQDSVFVSLLENPESSEHDQKYEWNYPDRMAIRTVEEYIGVLLSKLLVEYDILLQDDQNFGLPRLVTIFARSIARVQQDVDEYVHALSNIDIGKEKSFLHDIEDIREEISMIQNILIQQETTWREFAYEAWPKSWKHGHEGQFKPEWKDDWDRSDPQNQYPSHIKDVDVENKWRVIQRPQEHFRKLRTQLDKLDRDAERVQRSIELKLDLKQRHASLKEARTATLMGASVFGFTIITIIFTPLSFMAGLFALPIDRFEVAQSSAPDSSSGGSGLYSTEYIGKWMATTEIVSLTVTIFCVWVALRYFTQGGKRKHQRRDRDASGTAKPNEGAAGSSSTSTPSSQYGSEDSSQDTEGEARHDGAKQGLRDWAVSMLEKLLNSLKGSKGGGQTV